MLFSIDFETHKFPNLRACFLPPRSPLIRFPQKWLSLSTFLFYVRSIISSFLCPLDGKYRTATVSLVSLRKKKVPDYYSDFSFCLLYDHQDRRIFVKKLPSHPKVLDILDRPVVRQKGSDATGRGFESPSELYFLLFL